MYHDGPPGRAREHLSRRSLHLQTQRALTRVIADSQTAPDMPNRHHSPPKFMPTAQHTNSPGLDCTYGKWHAHESPLMVRARARRFQLVIAPHSKE